LRLSNLKKSVQLRGGIKRGGGAQVGSLQGAGPLGNPRPRKGSEGSQSVLPHGGRGEGQWKISRRPRWKFRSVAEKDQKRGAWERGGANQNHPKKEGKGLGLI